jgi:hypothetical protein
MATLNQAEQRGAIDGLLRVATAGEDATRAAIILHYLKTVLPTFSWDAQLRTRAAIWAPFIESGLSIDAWCDSVIVLSGMQGQ